MSWNNGQGNGNGYGQQPQGGYQQQNNQQWNGGGYGGDAYDRLNNTKSVGGPRFPFIEDGRHKLAVVIMEEFMHSTDGPSARCLFEVLESNKHPIGSYVVKIFKICQPPKFQGGKSDADYFADLCRKLKGAPEGQPMGNDIRVLMKERAREQLARGTVIECVGVPNKKGTWVNLYWTSIAQTPQDIAAMRARLEAKGIPDTGNGNGSAPQQPQYNQPPQGGYQQAQQGYVQQPAPQQPQYNQPPQGGYQQMQNPVPQQGPGTPLLAQIPPQNNGPQGGNQGGGW